MESSFLSFPWAKTEFEIEKTSCDNSSLNQNEPLLDKKTG